MKIRFYHWWVYRLFRWVWTPVLRSNPEMAAGFAEYMLGWYKADQAIKSTTSINKEQL